MKQHQIDLWNEMNPVGSPCIVRRDTGIKTETRTRSTARLLNGLPVIWLEGIAGCYLLDRVRILETHEAPSPDSTKTAPKS